MRASNIYFAEGGGTLLIIIAVFFLIQLDPWWLIGALIGYYLPLGITIGFNKGRGHAEITGSESFLWLIASIATWALLSDFLLGSYLRVGSIQFMGFTLSTLSSGVIMGAFISMISAFLNFFGLKKLLSGSFGGLAGKEYVPDEDVKMINEKKGADKEINEILKFFPLWQRRFLKSLFNETAFSDTIAALSKSAAGAIYKLLYAVYNMIKTTLIQKGFDIEKSGFNFDESKFKPRDAGQLWAKNMVDNLIKKSKGNTILELAEHEFNETTKAGSGLEQLILKILNKVKVSRDTIKAINEVLKTRDDVSSKKKLTVLELLSNYEAKASDKAKKLAENIKASLDDIKSKEGSIIARSHVIVYSAAMILMLLFNLTRNRSNVDMTSILINEINADEGVTSLVPSDKLGKALKKIQEKDLIKKAGKEYYDDFIRLYKEVALELIVSISNLKPTQDNKDTERLNFARKVYEELSKPPEFTQLTGTTVS